MKGERMSQNHRIRRLSSKCTLLALSLVTITTIPVSHGKGITAFQSPITTQPRGRSLRMQNVGGGDVLVIGGGLAGLSTALELAQRGGKVVVVNRNEGESASLAAGGMLAPQAERLGSGAYLDLCLQSRRMYADWATNLESLSGGQSTGFAAAGGFLAPAFQGDAVDTWVPPPEAGPAYRLDSAQIRAMEPGMSEQVDGGWWFPEDMQVDARCTYRALREACLRLGVSILEGEAWDVEALVFHPVNSEIKAIKLRDGRRLSFQKVVVANGAWMNKLLPVPMMPIKGQMMSLRPRSGESLGLSRVIFGESCYLIPKSDGRLIIGATVEPGVWDDKVTAKGLHDLTSKALRILPGLGDLEVEETWSGLRPTTPDTLPVLGKTPWENLYVAGGYWRNGVLLAPRTGQLMADVIEGRSTPETSVGGLLTHFRWSRFLPSKERGGRGATAGGASSARQGSPVSRPASSRPVNTPIQLSPPPPPPKKDTSPISSPSSHKHEEGSHTHVDDMSEDDPYADYAKLNNELDTDEILREARRINREGLVSYGLGDDAVGREVAARFNVPSAGMSSEWDAFEEAAKKGVEGLVDYDLNYLNSRIKGLDHHVVAEEEEEDKEGIEELMMRLGYEYEDPRLGKIRAKEERRHLARQGLAPANPPPPAPSATRDIDAYEEFYCEDVRPKVGWEVNGKKERKAQGLAEEAPGVYNDDPYADYAKLKDDVEKDEIIREARRQNREGLVGYGMGQDAVGQAVAAKFNVPSAGMSDEWSQYEDAAKKGVEGLGEYDLNYLNAPMKGIGSSHDGEEKEGDNIADFMSRLGYEYVDPRVAKAQEREEKRRIVKGRGSPSHELPQQQQQQKATSPASTSKHIPSSSKPSASSPPPSSPPPTAPRKKEEKPLTAAPPPPSETRREDGPPPPWAHKIEALYQKVRENQAAARRARGQAPLPSPEDGVIIPFKNKPEEKRGMSREEVLSKLEVFRANKDGTLTKVERGQGLPSPWQPPPQQSPFQFNVHSQPPTHHLNSTEGGFQVLPRGGGK